MAWMVLLVVATLLTRTLYGITILTTICPLRRYYAEDSEDAEEGHGIGFISGSPEMRRKETATGGEKDDEEQKKESINGILVEGGNREGAEETDDEEMDDKERQKTSQENSLDKDTRKNMKPDGKDEDTVGNKLVSATNSTSKATAETLYPKWLYQRSKSLPTETLQTEEENLPRKLSLIQEEVPY